MLTIDRPKFFNHARTALFGGMIDAQQMAGMTAIINEFELREMTNTKYLAYMMATPYLETNKTMAGVREAYYLNPPGPHQNDATGPAEAYRRTLRYYPWYGRGLVQLTWEDNYRKMQKLTGYKVHDDPDVAMELKAAVAIMFEGMLDAESDVGDFTGVSLEDYLSGDKEDFYNARRIINSTDKAGEVADYARQFWAGLGGPSHARVLKMGMNGDDVKQLQHALDHAGYDVGNIDGWFGQITRRQLLAFQRANGLIVDGEVGPQVRRALDLA